MCIRPIRVTSLVAKTRNHQTSAREKISDKHFNATLCRRLQIGTTYHKDVKPRVSVSFLPADPYRNIRR